MMVNKILKHRRNIELYVDNMIVKSKMVYSHLTNLAEIFEVIKKFNMCLNPTKCVFKVSSGSSSYSLFTKGESMQTLKKFKPYWRCTHLSQ